MQKITIKVLSVILTIALLVGLAACTSTKTDVSDSVLNVGLLRQNTHYASSTLLNLNMQTASGNNDPSTLALNFNPFTADDMNSNQINGLIYESLLAYDTGLKEEFRLAVSAEYSENLQKVTYKLRENVVWHDGTPFTAADVVWTYRAIKDFPEGRYFQYLRYMKSIEAEDDHTVTMNYISPQSFNPAAVIPILPRHIWGELNTNDFRLFTNNDPVGTGSMIYSRMAKDSVSLIKNPAYYGEEPGPDQIQFTFYDSADAMIDAVKEGRADIVGGLRHTDQRALAGVGAVKQVSLPSFSRLILAMNVSGAEYSGGHPALLDVRVRKALDVLIDRTELLDEGDGDYGVPGDSLLPEAMESWKTVLLEPDTSAVNKTEQQSENAIDEAVAIASKGFGQRATETPSTDGTPSVSGAAIEGEFPKEWSRAEIAVKLLEEAGYADVGDDGIRVNAEGVPLSFRLFAAEDDDPVSLSIARKIANMAAAADIVINVEMVSQSRKIALINDDAPDFDLLILREDAGSPDPSHAMNLAITAFGRQINPFNYSNSFYDDLYRKQFKEMNREVRAETIREMDKIFAGDAPGLILLYPKLFQAYRTDRWSGYEDSIGGVIFNFTYDNYTDIRPLE